MSKSMPLSEAIKILDDASPETSPIAGYDLCNAIIACREAARRVVELEKALDIMVNYAQEWHEENAEKWGKYRKEWQDSVQSDIDSAMALLSKAEGRKESRWSHN